MLLIRGETNIILIEGKSFFLKESRKSIFKKLFYLLVEKSRGSEKVTQTAKFVKNLIEYLRKNIYFIVDKKLILF